MPRHFVSAGWPYFYDVPRLHNCVPMLFADVCARFYRLKGDDVFFLCGADEHGARTEYVATAYQIPPKQLLDGIYATTLPLLSQLGLSFNAFERTSDSYHQQFVQDWVGDLTKRELLVAGTQEVAWCARCKHHLPDRFLEGTCPTCGGKTYGNQCANKKGCAAWVEPQNVTESRCAVCAGSVEWRTETHLFFSLDRFRNEVLQCPQAPERDAVQVRDRIERTLEQNSKVCVTRDSTWGIPVSQMPGKTVYSWIESLLAKVSMTAKQGSEMETLYWKDPDTHRHFFMGMDGTPFYGALFPALLMASARDYSTAHWMLKPNEVFMYEGGPCSKSTGNGLWLEEALAIVPAEFWRFYILFMNGAVESTANQEIDFRWEGFCNTINTWLIDGLKGAVQARSEGPTGSTEAEQVAQLLEASKIGPAFHLLLKSIVENPSREKTARLAPLLTCFLPSAGESLQKGLSPYEMAPLYYREVQIDYQDRVDAKRSQRGLAQEIADARADTLCVCPSDLREK